MHEVARVLLGIREGLSIAYPTIKRQHCKQQTAFTLVGDGSVFFSVFCSPVTRVSLNTFIHLVAISQQNFVDSLPSKNPYLHIFETLNEMKFPLYLGYDATDVVFTEQKKNM